MKRQERGLMMFGNSVLRRISEHNREESGGGGIRQRNESLRVFSHRGNLGGGGGTKEEKSLPSTSEQIFGY